MFLPGVWRETAANHYKTYFDRAVALAATGLTIPASTKRLATTETEL